MQGINANRFVIESKGAADPLTDVKSNDANRLNRRVQFKVIEGGGFIELPEDKNEETPEELKNK